MNDETINIDEQLDILEETKSQIKQAIINKGQPVSDEDSFRSYATKIGNISTLNLQTKSVIPTTQQQIVTPDTPTYNGISQVTVSGVTSAIDSNIQEGNIKGGVSILGVAGKSSVVDTDDATATSRDIVVGTSAYINGTKVSGAISKRKNITAYSDKKYGNGRLQPLYTTNVLGVDYVEADFFTAERFLLDGNSVSNASTTALIAYADLATFINLTADKLKQGETILGITGTYTEQMKEYASETAMNNDIANISEGEVVKVSSSVNADGSYQLIYENNSSGLGEIPPLPSFASDYQYYFIRNFNSGFLFYGSNDPNFIYVYDAGYKMMVNVSSSYDYSEFYQGSWLAVHSTDMGNNSSSIIDDIDNSSYKFTTNFDIKVKNSDTVVFQAPNPIVTLYIKETTMKKLVKEEDTISPQEYNENLEITEDILGEPEIQDHYEIEYD